VRRLLLALALAPASACLFPDLGGLTEDAGAADAVASDAPSGDAADAGDASTIGDAGDAAAEASGSGYCATLGGTHALCEDFDEDGGFVSSFPITFVTAKASVALDTSAFVSPPSSLVVKTPQGGSSDHAYVQRPFTATASTVTYSFDVRFDSWTSASSPSGIFAAVIIDDGQPDFHVLSVYTTATYAALEESFRAADGGNSYIDHTFNSAFALGAWRRLSIAIDLVKRTVAASLDGNGVVGPVALDPSWKAGPPTITLGFTYVAAQTQSWQARYDDVVFDLQ
jgi:hypothetical protein